MRSLAMCWFVLAAACGGSSVQGTTPGGTHARDPGDAPASASASVADPAFIEQYAATMGFRLGRPADVQITPDGSQILFLRSGPRGFVRDLFSFDTRTGEERVLLTADGILQGAEEELSAEERARRERMRLAARGIASYDLSGDGRRILVPLSGRLFVVDREAGRPRELPTGEGYPNDASFSPDATKVAFVRNGDLFVVDVESGSERRLTRTASEHVQNGLAEFVAQEEMGRYRGYWWSPDGQQIVYQQTDTSGVERLHIADPMHPEAPPSASPYPRAGHDNAVVRLGIVSVRGGETRFIEWDREAFPYLATVRWSRGAPLTLLVQDRRQREERILAVDPRNLRVDVIHTERDDTWLNLDQDVPRWIAGGQQFLWTTEREGGWQLEVRTREGELVRALNAPDFGYEGGGLLYVDEERNEVWALASADPVEQHVWIVPLGGEGEPRRLTRGQGVHSATVGNGVWVHEATLLDGTRTYTVHRGEEQGREIRSVAEAPPFVPQIEFVTVTERDLRAVVIRPRSFESGHRYPVLLSVYGGPHHRVVSMSPYRYLLEQWYADHGYVVVSIDGRGTPGRGRAWERVIAGNFIELPLRDQVDGLVALGQRFPEMDMSRVGVYGWSFGGYFSAMAVMQRPDVFHAGVAGAPVADWADYDTHYTERYIGLPQENEEGYAASSVLTHAPRLERPLLILHGTADDNVYFTHAIKMSDALLRAARPHDFLPLSGFTHMVADPDVTRARHQLIARWFARHLSP
jgi:dipeptidyl-peptidase-4